MIITLSSRRDSSKCSILIGAIKLSANNRYNNLKKKNVECIIHTYKKQAHIKTHSRPNSGKYFATLKLVLF